MINEDKWINSLPKTNIKFSGEVNQIDHEKWISTIPKKKTYSAVSKYTLMTVLFVCGLLFVSVVKNGTRNLEKEINNLRASVNVVKFNLDQAILDNEVIKSPENISRLAKEYLDTDFISYKKSQIMQLNEDTKTIIKINKKDNNLSTKIKSEITKKIEKKKTEIRKLQELYSKPGSLPGVIKTQVAMKIEKKKIELKNIYSEPKDIFALERLGRWSAIQVVKLFLGMPIIPGK
jgi:hypothetical protein